MTAAVDRVLEENAKRYRFLRALYDATGGDTHRGPAIRSFFAELGLSQTEGYRIFRYLYEEGLATEREMNHFSITHRGVQEVEASILQPQRATDHFSPPVIQYVAQNYTFHAPVGAVQAGAGSVAHVTQNVGHDFREILDAVRTAREQLQTVPAARRQEGAELLDGIEAEVRSPQPSRTRLRALGRSAVEFLRDVGAGTAANVLAQVLISMTGKG